MMNYAVFSVEEMKIDRNSLQFALCRHKMWVGIPTMRQDIRSNLNRIHKRQIV